MTTRSEFSEAMALARLVAEKTGCGLERALGTLAALSEWEPQAPQAPQAKHNAPLPENVLNFISTCPTGSNKTVGEIYAACGLEMPKGGKALSYLLQRSGWQTNGKQRKGCHVFVKGAA